MTQTGELIGLPALTQTQLGWTKASITAAGSTSANATACGAGANFFILTATGSDGVRMNSATPLLTEVIVANTSGSNGVVYPPTGGKVNGGSTDAGETIASTTVQVWYRITTTDWVAVLGA